MPITMPPIPTSITHPLIVGEISYVPTYEHRRTAQSLLSLLATSDQKSTMAGSAIVRSRKGIQAILLARWSKTSVENFLKVLADPKSPQQIEFAFVPIFGTNQYQNANHIIARLLKANKQVTVGVHLSFHHGSLQASADTKDQMRQLKSAAETFNAQFLAEHGGKPNLRIKLSASLEDYFTASEFANAVKTITSTLTFDTCNIVILRSHTDRTLTQSRPETITGILTSEREQTFVLGHEIHGDTSNAYGFNAYSNDGNFVFFEGDLNKNSNPDESDKTSVTDANGKTKYSLSSFINNLTGKGKSYTGTILLWRPAYNLFAKTIAEGDTIAYSKLGRPNTRKDSDSMPAFDSTEQVVLRQFLDM